MANTDYRSREVIENTLLTALEDEGAVAVLMTQADLKMFIGALEQVPVKGDRLKDMMLDMKELYEAAFNQQEIN